MPFLTDLRRALRFLAASPLFTLTAVGSLAIGVGASAATFSLVDALVFQSAPGIRDAGRVVEVGRSNDGDGFDNLSYPIFKYLRDHTTTLTGLAGVQFGGGPLSLASDGTSERIFGTLVSHDYFDVLGTRPALGRFFRPDEDAVPDARPVVVLSHAFWTRHFDQSPEVLERRVRLNNRDFTIVGVAEPGFQGTTFVGTDVWAPIAMIAAATGRETAKILDEPRDVWMMAVGRLRPGVSRTEAQAELNVLLDRFRLEEPRVNPRHAVAVGSTGRIPAPVRRPFAGFLGLLFAMTAALVVIACTNVAGMLLARATGRRREMATRLAIGAGRGRLVVQLLAETVVLFVAAGLAAIPLTFGLTGLLERFLPALPVPINLEVPVNMRVVTFAMVTALVTAVVFGLAPARHALGGNLAPLLHGGTATPDRRRLRLRNALVVAQVALSLTLVVIAMLFGRTLEAASTMDSGFRTVNVLIASVDVSLSGYRGQRAAALVEQFVERLAGIDGVTSAAAARMIPLQGGRFGLGSVRVPNAQGPREDGHWDADWDLVSPDYFRTVGMDIVDGRAFAAADRDGSPLVAIVNETFAARVWPGRSPVGQAFYQRTGPDGERPVQVVGVARDARYRYLGDPPRPFIYVPMAQQPAGQVELYVRHGDRPVAADVRAAMAAVEPNVPIVMLQSFDDAVAVGLVPQRLAGWIAGSVGTVGLLLAALGLYGVMAFLVVQRTREIAIRMALGASGTTVRGMVMRQATWLAAVGGLLGLCLAAGAASLVRGLLVGVGPMDPVSFGATGILLPAVVLAACWAPVRRAAATDPAAALRSE